jgi:hypothetical protein
MSSIGRQPLKVIVWLCVFATAGATKQTVFTPHLSFTGAGFSERKAVPFLGSMKWEAAPLGAWEITTQTSVQFTVRHFYNLSDDTHRYPYHVAGLLVWVRSDDGNVIFSAPAILNFSSVTQELDVRFTVADPGAYTLQLVSHSQTVTEEGAHGTHNVILPVQGGPWHINVRDNTTRWVPTVNVQFPAKVCTEPTQGNGRWVRCESVGIHFRNCLRDGWLFVPHACRHEFASIAEVLIRSKLTTKPLWLVIGGSSIERGTYHALIDLLAGVRHDTHNQTMRAELFLGESTQPGKGSLVKCWGWFDCQIGHLRLSYIDLRTVYNYEQDASTLTSYGVQAETRMCELLGEGGAGPDVVVLNVILPKVHELASFAVEIMAKVPRWKGKMVLSAQKNRFLNGGIKMDHVFDREHGRNVHSSMTEAGPGAIANALSTCGVRCRHISPGQLSINDQQIMAWSFVFDMENSMSDTHASQHFHYLAPNKHTNIRPSVDTGYDDTLLRMQAGICSEWHDTPHQDTRIVYGAVVEMDARTMLKHLMDNAGVINDPNVHIAKAQSMCATNEPPKVHIRVCADCPETACCPWVPPASNPVSISTFQKSVQVNVTAALARLEMHSCYDSPHLSDQIDKQ